MQLTKRFFTMNVLAVLISVVATALAVIVFIAVYTRAVGPEAIGGQDLKRILEVRAELAKLKNAASGLEFEQLLEPQLQHELSEQVRNSEIDTVIFENRKLVFASGKFNSIDLEKALLLSDHASEFETIEVGSKTRLFARTDYALPSGDKGTALFLAPVQLETKFYLYVGIFTVSFFLLTFFITNFIVSYRFARGFIGPVARLKDAAVNMSEGDLSGGIAEEGEGEVRELCRSLESMRIRLKESLYLQEKYDDNRRFLISSISHDLKTPVTSILGYIEGIMDGVASTPEKRNEYLATVCSKAMLVNAMIDDLLLYSKLDMNQLPYHFEQTDLAAYFDDCVADHRYEFEQAGLRLTLANKLQQPLTIRIDRERMKRVIQNILDNARRYADQECGKVEIKLRETRTSAIIEIKDNGKGIPEQDLPHIFERFYRADSSRQGDAGSGLGLAIAKQIVEGHEGKIWVTSQAGEGTRMLISLKK
ncbi:two-component sensor histidine kinase [Ammoniphilus oxalaticus]|uniref:histidine kinase n=1 Tax=Ammoniphilus oxalaticus TaxID=66863 RepID=A0A419SM13_9BACL|nr:HAMP domain-containing sensor histidine kinase [Ammoniphilus oxalaticus]RKD25022.1 two-component sensor histidine kinase [Ammoniphilus oxalaticus]